MDDARVPFGLTPQQVPRFPQSGHPVDILRWCVAVMDDDDRDLGFAASLLAHCCKTGGLTDKQLKYAKRTVTRVRGSWEHGELKCQGSGGPDRLRLVASSEGLAS